MYTRRLALYSIPATIGLQTRSARTRSMSVLMRRRREGAECGGRLPPHLYFLVSAVFHYLGPALAVLLFAHISVLGVAWLRIASAALVFAVWRRPWRKFAVLDREGRLLIVSLGAVFAAMNACF